MTRLITLITRLWGISSMDNNDKEQFFISLSSCCEIVGKPKLSSAAAKLLFSKLSDYPLDWVIWGMTKAIENCNTGFDFTLKLIRDTIEKEQGKNEFREYAIMKLEQQAIAGEERQQYIESEEFKRNQEKAKECLRELRGDKK